MLPVQFEAADLILAQRSFPAGTKPTKPSYIMYTVWDRSIYTEKHSKAMILCSSPFLLLLAGRAHTIRTTQVFPWSWRKRSEEHERWRERGSIINATWRSNGIQIYNVGFVGVCTRVWCARACMWWAQNIKMRIQNIRCWLWHFKPFTESMSFQITAPLSLNINWWKHKLCASCAPSIYTTHRKYARAQAAHIDLSGIDFS